MKRPFRQVDVFGAEPHRGNPVAVVLDGEGLTLDEMHAFARWMNLSETTFVLPPTHPEADYRVRILTSATASSARETPELPFAGHPTLGTCHARLESNAPAIGDLVVQECPAGLVAIDRGRDRLAFAAPPLLRSGDVEEELVRHIASLLRVDRSDIVDAQWVDDGPGWVAVLLVDAAAVLTLEPGAVDLDLGVVGFYPPGSPEAYEVRAFFPKDGATAEDPVTGSLNASIAQWLIDAGRVRPPYVASQGTAIGRAGRVHLSCDDRGTIWIGGLTVTHITGEVDL